MKRQIAIKMLIHQWHRRLGLLALFFVIILSVTGILLNHTEALKLNQRTVENHWLLDWYGLNPKGQPTTFFTNGHWVSQWDKQIFVDGIALMNSEDPLQGAVAIEDKLLLALTQNLLLLDQHGQLIEQISSPVETLLAIAEDQHRFVIKGKFSTKISDKNVLNWTDHAAPNTLWSMPGRLDDNRKTQLRETFRGQGLNLERIILDLHSGRLIHTKWGVYVMDAAALILILLGFSGFWVWVSRRPKTRR